MLYLKYRVYPRRLSIWIHGIYDPFSVMAIHSSEMVTVTRHLPLHLHNHYKRCYSLSCKNTVESENIPDNSPIDINSDIWIEGTGKLLISGHIIG